MSYRLFEDSKRTEWQVWDIIPRLEERRKAADTDRRVDITVIPFADRRHSPRRLASIRRTLLRGSYARGWLCFESSREKRRLSPIPGDWTTCDDETLEAYCNDAQVVSSPGRILAFDNEDPPDNSRGLFAEAG